ncbi:2-dehydro-3-deoxy-6-phosphogalactonate aldolase [uncultured Cohaesibacter sp.]|uniref:2-dehydro-3-deoxy-6-phosphogalactonate aldolase n=1 Tax=uncultured Cohaesibacter sp. TaxID=1002546 RepID=UPI0029C7D0CF|nr:2-dehydro-3-deoxy-6-phosphogalactonate aldolase [uncultured Cohaesibacter sp.]
MVSAFHAGFEAAFARMPLVAILRGIPAERAKGILGILVEEGFTLIEVPLTSPDAKDAIGQMVEAAPEGIMIGAGTVLSAEDVEAVYHQGARFIVTPNTDPAVIGKANALAMPSCIGCMTPTEALLACRSGATVLKLFPAARLGGQYIKDIKVVLPPDMRLLAVGGVGPDEFETYLSAGAAGFGIGSDLWKPGRSDEEVRRAARALVDRWKALRSE